MKIFLFYSLLYQYMFIYLPVKTDNKQINTYQYEVL